jgi:hypothetical protein
VKTNDIKVGETYRTDHRVNPFKVTHIDGGGCVSGVFLDFPQGDAALCEWGRDPLQVRTRDVLHEWDNSPVIGSNTKCDAYAWEDAVDFERLRRTVKERLLDRVSEALKADPEEIRVVVRTSGGWRGFPDETAPLDGPRRYVWKREPREARVHNVTVDGIAFGDEGIERIGEA